MSEKRELSTLETEPIADPGLPAHEPRPTDVDASAEKRAERQVASLFGLSTIFTLLFCVAYFVFEIGDEPDVFLGLGASNVALGICLGLALLCIGVGAIQWARKLMGDEEIIEYRHPGASPDEDREEALKALSTGTEESGIARRPLIRNSLLGAMGALGLLAIIPLRDLGPLPGDKLFNTIWTKGMRVVQDVDGAPISPADMEIGQLVNGQPGIFFEENAEGEPEVEGSELLKQKAKAAVVIVKMQPDDITPGPGPRELGRRRRPVLLQDLHPRRVPDLALGAADPPPALPLPPVHVRPGRQRQGRLRPCRSCGAPTTIGSGRRGLPDRDQRLHRAGRPELLGTRVI